jgi:hypothetical protein
VLPTGPRALHVLPRNTLDAVSCLLEQQQPLMSSLLWRGNGNNPVLDASGKLLPDGFRAVLLASIRSRDEDRFEKLIVFSTQMSCD